MATTFEALGRDEQACADRSSAAPRTLDAGHPQLPGAASVPRRLRELSAGSSPSPTRWSARCRPPRGARGRHAGAAQGAGALRAHRGCLRRSRGPWTNPSTLLALQDLDDAEVAAPLLEYIAPYQTVCNYWNYYWTGLGEHVSEPVRGGTAQRASCVRQPHPGQPPHERRGRPARGRAEGPGPATAPEPAGDPLERSIGVVRPGDRRAGQRRLPDGQRGYLDGPDQPATATALEDPDEGGGSHIVAASTSPASPGRTYKSRGSASRT